MVVYMRNCFKASTIENLSTTTDINSQQLWLKVQCRKTKSFVLCAAYRPDSVSMSRFLDDFSASFMDSLLLGMVVLITGDLNADVLPGSSCPEGRALMDLCNSLNLSQLVTKPTRSTDTSMTLIDVALTTNESFIGGGHIKVKSSEASAFLYFHQKLQNLQSRVISERFGVCSFPHCKYF